MSDKKLNEVPKVTDMAYVPVIMEDGSIGQISKSDLASVAAELMPVYTPNIVKGLATTLNSMTFTSGNLNDCNTNIQGLSVVASDANNLPDGSSHLFTYGGILITLRFGNDAYMLQFLAPRVDGRILYFRIKIDSWLLWNQFALN